MMINRTLIKEVCDCCNKNVLIGQRFTECQVCSKIIHQNCFKKSNFTVINLKSTCPNCILLVPERYTPFKDLGEQNEVASGNEHDDKSYNENFLEMFDCINKASSVLESFSQYTLSSVHMLTSDEIDFTTLFYNIDGNKSNFDTFAAEISLQKHKYSIIGLTETNTGKQKGICITLITTLASTMTKWIINPKVLESAFTYTTLIMQLSMRRFAQLYPTSNHFFSQLTKMVTKSI